MIARNEQRLGPILELVHVDVVPPELEPIAEVGAADRGWPRTLGPIGRAWTPEQLAEWLLEHARDERDERLWVRVVRGEVRDAALGCRWAPAGRSWRSLGTTDELLGAAPEVLAFRLEATT